MYDKILVPTDGGTAAQKGVEHAIELASAVGATVHALYVIDLPGAPRTPHIWDDEEEIREEYESHGEEITAEVCDAAADAGVECIGVLRTGTVHEEVSDYAEQEGVDLVVMGTGYRGKFGALLGGNAEKVVRTCPVPVTTIRLDEEEN
ncbi:universal stress protein [Halobacteriales archaeon QS_1_68_17]|nr:MAG: universal stress protein [Halobacteriales archaeon QS_1_68_17]